mgnify:FL=1
MDRISFDDLAQSSLLSLILDNVDVGVMVYSAAGDVLFVNTTMINWRNIPRQEYLKMNVRDFRDVLDVCVFDLAVQEKRRVSRLQYYQDFRKTGGPTRVRVVTATPIFDSVGGVECVVVMLQDVEDFEARRAALLAQHQIMPKAPIQPREEKVSIVAKSLEIRQLISVLGNIAPLDSTVLLYGESGSGKEVFTHYIHEHSNRADKPLVAVNCAAFPENLIEAELFGYEKGSFTGANREGKVGLVEAADGGTLFLDEINSLPLSVQGKVLRMIEEKSVQRIGAVRAKPVDFRLIAATNRDLRAMVQEGTFREDLYYRLHVIPITIPPVRSRKDDIVPLCLHFLEYFCKKYDLKKSFSDRVLEEVQQYDWPGNVREIRNFVERMVVMTPPAAVMISSIPSGMLNDALADTERGAEEPLPGTVPPLPGTRNAAALDRETILAALAACGGNRGKTAEYLGISRRYLQYKIREYHISPRCRYET